MLYTYLPTFPSSNEQVLMSETPNCPATTPDTLKTVATDKA